jgi:hypothetical protein
MGRDRLRRFGLTAPFEIFLRGHHDPPHLADVARNQRRIRQVTDPHRQVDALFHQVDHAIRQPQVDRDLGIALQIGRHDRADMKPSKAVRGGHHQPPARFCPFALGRDFGLLDVGEDPAGALQIACADVGQGDRPRGPLQQAGAETLLQRRDQPRHARRRQPEFARGRGKPLQVGDGDKRLHGIDTVHAIISYIAIVKCQPG